MGELGVLQQRDGDELRKLYLKMVCETIDRNWDAQLVDKNPLNMLWLPIIPLQIGLVLKPGPQEPWTPYRMAEAYFQAGIPREAISVYPGLGDVGAAVLARTSCQRGSSRLQPSMSDAL